MITFLQDSDSDSASEQSTNQNSITEYLFYCIEFALDVVIGAGQSFLALSLSSQVLLSLIFCFVLNIVLINIAWKIYGSTIRDPEIPGIYVTLHICLFSLY